MRFCLAGTLVRSGGHDEDKAFSIEELFDAKNRKTAIIIARAMIQSKKLKEEKLKNSVSRLVAVLKDNSRQAIWRTNLVPEFTLTKVVVSEHFEEEVLFS
ncbi:MAG: hypothetical protein A3B86_01540 [Candidatus Yanofskybacteria bacterium RIFCSPHIGHO2_02_FULL_38_22b]|uniref:Uncharacterized protein n=1 Tax=Candidatus Yanofskybacteria bacterium RIFCSPHIGHO2_02_FULL_38_22b TaxID=1802673 RepID=A0A1F8F2R3_9BACT|nr:MAG: hypothetical protein A3B86_01540 [Candidatus Yanofskybacteria bacterium RIFCSPHIGHO2_02_FULL_38_22b]OGN19827.1 MAG: hypothetical protein A2910_02090 [Candidatus Yanofskybacteria bacterium RIFCSPLOWO2_01_FULL_39_28]